MQIAVCDDEKMYLDLFVSNIKSFIAMQEKNYESAVIDCYSSGEQLIKAYESGKEYDLVFLDIRMKEISGFDAAKTIREYDDKTLIIFITSLRDYILGSFEYRPFWFLIKPVSEEKFMYVFKKAAAYILDVKSKRHSFFTRDQGLISLEIDRILYLESSLRKIIIYTNGQKFTYYANLKEEEEKLTKYNFVRVHNGYLVNMAHIYKINKTNIVLKNSVTLPLSEHRQKAVFDCFTSYLARC